MFTTRSPLCGANCGASTRRRPIHHTPPPHLTTVLRLYPCCINHIKNGNGRYKLTRFPAELQSLRTVCGQPIFLFSAPAKVNKLFDFTLLYRLLLFSGCFCLRFGLLREPHSGGKLQPKSRRFFRSSRGRIFYFNYIAATIDCCFY